MKYVWRPGGAEVKTGTQIGTMTDEIEKDHGVGSYITVYAATGSKSYGYIGVKGDGTAFKPVVKWKGVSQNFSTEKLLRFENLEKIAKEGYEVTIPDYRQIQRTADLRVTTRIMNKKCRNTFSKRVLRENYMSVPYGYRD